MLHSAVLKAVKWLIPMLVLVMWCDRQGCHNSSVLRVKYNPSKKKSFGRKHWYSAVLKAVECL